MSKKCGKYTYKEEERFGSGEYGCVYLARNEEEKEGEKKLYVIKFPLWEKMDSDRRKAFNNEIKILKKLSKIPKNNYTSIIYDSITTSCEDEKKDKKLEENKIEENKIEENKIEENKIEENKIEENKIEVQNQNKENEKIKTKEKPYYVMDYFSRGLLVDYASRGLTERQIKFIFKKIIESYKFLHEKGGILHLDIKLDNTIKS